MITLTFAQEIHSPFTHIGWMLAKQGRDKDLIWDMNQVFSLFRERERERERSV